ncbi:outer membrane autotransporter barrel domain-containing protein [Pseudomonas synxantha]|uniref:Outer membrane autotransporter barrel domain-containing protein n=1 Tax=Pseudomonas synxantha TaxID=47883 RepID=A0AAX3IET6_9PSED|nr:autotransporter outer membrane beta-barrel domain-containing protein [Pseudomonas synxantha]KRP56793.1 membrane protein [Pseudomonas synxantha]MBI6563377.1 pertactin family autotransporter [Pseudomonas synxantha]MBI6580660.1 pertactin family autotransporter [Pseudomonas synxantha]MBI6642799.1 pertactin family autotransporter [Pseudomonas synxantha]SDU48721.1 outer membrane autotransporter barrel domain-containing protein [Pseudomonas synxantha]
MISPASQRFRYSRLSSIIKLVAAAPLCLLSQQAMSTIVVDGTVGSGKYDVRPGAAASDYLAQKGATLTVHKNANVKEIRATSGSTLTLTGANVSSVHGSQAAIALSNSSATISDARITSHTSGGLNVARQVGTPTGSYAQVDNSEITGATYGANVTSHSLLELNNSVLVGQRQQGLRLLGGAAIATDSEITGGTTGVVMSLESATALESPHLILDGSRVTGLDGPAINVLGPITAEIDVTNGSSLQGQNGNMLELTQGGSANMRVRFSELAGNIQVGADSALDLNLDHAILTGDVINNGGSASVGLNNGSVLTGRLENVDTLAINSDATWVMVDDQHVGDLLLAGGNVKFGDTGTFYKLDVDNLSGNGTFVMSADFATLTGDFLNVTGTSSGDHQLLIASTGADPLSEDRLHVVHTEDGGAKFSLVGERVDVGTYSYSLVDDNEGKDWLLDPGSKVISPSTNSVLALANAAPSVLYGEMTNLRTRMGELRHSDGQSTGLWSRAYGNKFEVNNSDKGMQYNQTQRGFTLGADVPLTGGDGQWLAGFMAGHSTSDLDLSRGSKATVDSYYVGGYATWLDAESGLYFDGVLKFNRLHNESDVAMSDGKKAKGNYTQNAVTASAEVGRNIKLDDGYFVEPYGQLATAIIQRQSYELDNGLQAEGARTASVVGKLGVTAGRDIQLDSGSVLQPYLRTAVAHEFNQSNKVSVNGNSFNNDLSGSRVEMAAGIAMAVSKNWKVHADVERSMGKSIDQPWGVNVGLRYDF